MSILRKLMDRLRTWVGVRTPRQILPAHGKPSLGSSIVKDRFRVRLKTPVDDELWAWLSHMGWRAMPVQNNRRRYLVVSEKAFEKLVKADPSQRPAIHAQLVDSRSVRRDQNTAR